MRSLNPSVFVDLSHLRHAIFLLFAAVVAGTLNSVAAAGAAEYYAARGLIPYCRNYRWGAGRLRVSRKPPAPGNSAYITGSSSTPKQAAATGEGENISACGQAPKVERHAARDALESRAGKSRSREIPFVNDDTVPDRAKIVVRVGVVGLPRVNKAR